MKTNLYSSILAAVRPGSIPAADVAVEPSASHEEAGSVLSLGGDVLANAAAAVAGAGAASGKTVTAEAAFAAGYQAAADHFAAILGAEGVAGNAKRMGAALQLAVGSPGMSAEAVVSFISANVAEASAPAAPAARPAATYEQRRVDAAALTTPSTSPAKADAPSGLNPSAVFAHRRAHTAKKEA